MDLLFFLGLALGAIASFFIFKYFFKGGKRENRQEQSVVLMEKIRSVCKFITVEGDFSEIYHYQNVKDKIANFLLGKKKAIILIKAKAHIGFDLTKIEMDSDPDAKTITLRNFPQPQILSIETDFSYYDKSEGWANYFTSDDLTEVTRNAKQHIIDKVPESGLMEQAKKEAIMAIKMMEGLAATIGWKLDYNALVLDQSVEDKKIER
ncbi:uncharacterized protein DUF4230 [Nonlabens dokdonensis]|jgi:hypothetical protein|uniref:DUF4230 domain-containing protein n=2 Tax=Nonlabens dokdonensis TaxID=328515 RepID=L7W4Z0_NONDD|nr:DUF4230 domain-containing protein [Nonlabens dokdonensis]AGC76705.1 hypothetical protein DDD_1578 [Nonlabens dokdonensis DSW-6]PZX44352.1 uncharacterized protein DUF4230 [Nonlabens dokdonensis]